MQLSEERTPLLHCSVQLGASYTSLVAWDTLPVHGLIQRFLSNCGVDADPAGVELHLGRYLLPLNFTFGTVVARWLPSVDARGVVRLKAVIPRHPSGKARVKLEARGPPLHTVRQVTGRAVAAMAIPAGPARLQGAVGAAADVCLLPFTFTNWTDAWDYGLMKVAVQLFRVLLPDKPSAASSVLQACSSLLDLPAVFAPRGKLFQGLCTLQLHLYLLQSASELRTFGLVMESAPAIAPAVSGVARSSCGTSRAAGSSRGVRAVAGSSSSSSSSSSSGSSRNGGCSSNRAREARHQAAALDALNQLLDKAAARVGGILEQFSYYGSELSGMLDCYKPPSRASSVGAGTTANSHGGESSAAPAARPGGHAAVSPPATQDLRLQVADVLEPYAAMQLLEAFGRMAVVSYPAFASAPLLPPGTLPCNWDCHRSLFHAILELGIRAGISMRDVLTSEGDGGMPADGEVQTRGSASAPAGGLTLELPMIARTLDALLQFHVQAHVECGSGGSARRSRAAPAAAGEESSDDSSSVMSSIDEGPRCCPRTPAACQLPPCLDWLHDVTSLLEAACDVYQLAGGLDTEAEAEAEAELQPRGASAGALDSATAAPAASGLLSAVAAPAAAHEAVAAVVVAPAIAVGAAMDPTRRDDPAFVATTVAGAGAELAASAVAAGQPSVRTGTGGVGAATASDSPGPTVPSTPLFAREAGGSCVVGGCGSGEPDHDLDSGDAAKSLSFVSGESAAELSLSKALSSVDAAVDGKEDAGLAPATPPQGAAEVSHLSGAAAAAAAVAAVAAAASAGSALKAGTAAVTPGPGPAPAATVAAAAAAAAAVGPPVLLSARLMIVDALHRAFQCPCLMEQLLAGGTRAGVLCERAVWRHPRLAGCAPAAAYYKQALDNLLRPLYYVYDEDDYDAPVVYVDRSDMLGSSFASLMDVEEFLDHEGICVKFEDEEAHGDGVLREWLTEVAATVFDPNAGLFRLCEGDARALHPSPAGRQQDDQLDLLRFAGRIIGLAMRARVPLGFHLSTALFKLLQHPGEAGRARLGLADLAQLEPRLAATCGQIASASNVEALGLTFVASCGSLGLAHEVPLLPGGRGEDVIVTTASRREYLDRLVLFYCTWGCSSEHGVIATRGGGGSGSGAGREDDEDDDDCDKDNLDVVTALAQGLAEALFRLSDPDDDDRVEQFATRLRAISAAAFNSRLGGQVAGIDVEDWRSHTSAPAFKTDRERAVLTAFWDVVSELSADDQRRLLQFWTGISHLPAGGFKHLSQQLQLVPARPDDCFGLAAAAAAPDAGTDRGTDSGAAADDTEPGRPGPAITASSDGGSGSGSGSGGGGGATEGQPGAEESSRRDSAGGQSTLEMGIGPGVEAAQRGEGAGTSTSTSTTSSNGSGSGRSSGEGGASGASGSAGRAGAASDVHRGSSGDGGPAGNGSPAAGDLRQEPSGTAGGAAAVLHLLAAHTCFFQLRLPLLPDKASMREAVAESLANLGGFWNERSGI